MLAQPAHAPGRMCFVLSTFLGPISGEEDIRSPTSPYVLFPLANTPPDAAPCSRTRFRQGYLLSLQRMIETDYPIPSYVADVFDNPDGWVETPQPVSELLPHERRAYTPLIARWCAVIPPPRALLNST
jgi:RNA exonuclease 1